MSEYTQQVNTHYASAALVFGGQLVSISYYRIPNLPTVSPDAWDAWYHTAYAQAAGDRVARGKLTREYRKGVTAFERLKRWQEQP